MPLPPHEQTIADLTRLLEVSRQLGATVELQPLLVSIERAALEVLDCERVNVFLLDKARRELFSRLSTGVTEIRFRPIAGSLAKLRSGWQWSTCQTPMPTRGSTRTCKTTGFRTRSILTLPMKGYDGDLIGVLQLLNKTSGPFTSYDEELALSLGALAGVASTYGFGLDFDAEGWPSGRWRWS